MRLARLAAFYLVFVSGFLLGSVLVFQQLWPNHLYRQLADFVAGDPTENTTFFEKIANDAGLRPARFIHSASEDRSGLAAVTLPEDRQVFAPSRQLPRFRSSLSSGGFLISGVFDFAEGLHGTLFVDHEGVVRRHWPYSQNNDDWSTGPDTRADGLGFELLEDGSFVSRLGETLYRMTWCGKVVWKIGGRFHHSIADTGFGAIWTWRDDFMVKVAVADGSVLEEIHIEDIILANPDISAFEMLTRPNDWKWADQTSRPRLYAATQPQDGIYYQDPFHQNDVEPLMPDQAPFYSGFEVGDLLVSMRHLNLVFVVRPSTREILWNRQGLTSRQHDPDWNRRGTITVFDNRNHQAWSHVLEFDVNKHRPSFLVNGAEIDMFSMAGGSHQLLNDGSIIVVPRNQGRMLNVLADGQVLFELINRYDNDNVLRTYNSRYVSDEEVSKWEEC